MENCLRFNASVSRKLAHEPKLFPHFITSAVIKTYKFYERNENLFLRYNVIGKKSRRRLSLTNKVEMRRR